MVPESMDQKNLADPEDALIAMGCLKRLLALLNFFVKAADIIDTGWSK